MITNARSTDPITSHLAGQEAEQSGRSTTHREICYVSVCIHPGHTAAEIAKRTRLERHEASRRLPELREKGLIVNGEQRICEVTKHSSMTWMVADRRCE